MPLAGAHGRRRAPLTFREGRVCNFHRAIVAEEAARRDGVLPHLAAASGDPASEGGLVQRAVRICVRAEAAG